MTPDRYIYRSHSIREVTMNNLKFSTVALFAIFLWHSAPVTAEAETCTPLMEMSGYCLTPPPTLTPPLTPTPPPPPVIRYTFEGLKNLIGHSGIKVAGIERALLAKVANAEKKHLAGMAKVSKNILKATKNHVKALSRKNIDQEMAGRIISYIRILTYTL